MYFRRKDGSLGVYEVDTTDHKAAIDAVQNAVKDERVKYSGAILASIK